MLGKKTYLTVAVAIAYLIGGKLGWWVLDKELLTGVGILAVAFLRSGLAQATKS